MSPTVSLSISHISSRKSQEISKETHIPKSTFRENPYQKTPTLSKRKLLNSTALGHLGVLSLVQPAKSAEPDSPIEATSNRMAYSRFLQYLEEGAVRKIALFENGTVAVAEINNPTLDKIQRVKILLPGLPQELLRKMKEKIVDFDAHPME